MVITQFVNHKLAAFIAALALSLASLIKEATFLPLPSVTMSAFNVLGSTLGSRQQGQPIWKSTLSPREPHISFLMASRQVIFSSTPTLSNLLGFEAGAGAGAGVEVGMGRGTGGGAREKGRYSYSFGAENVTKH